MARTKTNTRNDTKTLTASWRNRHLEKLYFCKLLDIVIIYDIYLEKDTDIDKMRSYDIYLRINVDIVRIYDIYLKCDIDIVGIYDIYL